MGYGSGCYKHDLLMARQYLCIFAVHKNCCLCCSLCVCAVCVVCVCVCSVCCVLFALRPVTARQKETKRRRFVCTQSEAKRRTTKNKPISILEPKTHSPGLNPGRCNCLKRRTAGSCGDHMLTLFAALASCLMPLSLSLPLATHAQQTGVKFGMWVQPRFSFDFSVSAVSGRPKRINFKYYFGRFLLFPV